MLRWLFLVPLLLFSLRAYSYPEFISYGYKSCVTCHHSPAGGGGLNDYGRALFAVEIAASPFWSKASDEKLGERSNFLGSYVSPYWLKPGLKYRRLYNEIHPGSKDKISKYYTMQSDLNIASFTSEDMDLGFVGTLAYLSDPLFALPNRPIEEDGELMAREYYIRWMKSENVMISLGFMDKAYGIRHPDHTSFNRSPIGLGQNHQTHGLQVYYHKEAHELFFQPFLGNLHLAGDQQSRGWSGLYEYEWKKNFVPGLSAKYERSKADKSFALAGHSRIGFGKGHALLFELGYKEQEVGDQEKKKGIYEFLELSYLLRRGLNFQSILQSTKADFTSSEAEYWRWGLGFLYFPFQRMEWRVQALQNRVRSGHGVEEDQWVGQVQLHLSL